MHVRRSISSSSKRLTRKLESLRLSKTQSERKKTDFPRTKHSDVTAFTVTAAEGMVLPKNGIRLRRSIRL